MKKVLWKIIFLVFIFLIILFGYLAYHSLWDTQSIPKGDLIRTVESPKRYHVANIYSGTGGATVDFSIIVEIEDKKTGKKKNIFFQYPCEDVDVKWLSESEIQINEIKLNINKDVYDSRH
jgi:hypothetical protein